MSQFDFDSAFAGLFRESYGRILAAVAKEFRDLELAEDALQEALEVAARKWAQDGLPDNAAGWLYVASRNKAIDALRREARQKRRALNQARENAADSPQRQGQVPGLGFTTMYGISGPPDERLSLIFACCHPAINEPAQVALTLHTLSGLQTNEIAAAFLLNKTAVAQRIVRAKRKIKDAGIPFAIPDIEDSPERLSAVLSVIYLIFNAGYTAHDGQSLLKTNLCDEALYLTRMLVQLIGHNAEVEGLAALLLFQDSRREARTAADGSPVLLRDQDRSRWDTAKIQEATYFLNQARARSPGGFYQTQAEIAGVHARSPSAEETAWPEILRHYDQLLAIHPSAVVRLNRAVAISMALGPAEALKSLDQVELAQDLAGYRYYHATRGEFLLELGRRAEAVAAFERALQESENEQERTHLARRIHAARDSEW